MIPVTLLNNRTRTATICAALLLAFTCGCTQDPAALALPEISVETPDQIQLDGTMWTKSDFSEADHACLAKFFERNQQLVGSPEMEGEPVLYTSGKNDRRFYWLNAAVEGSRWTCVHFAKNGFTTSDGTGSPF